MAGNEAGRKAKYDLEHILQMCFPRLPGGAILSEENAMRPFTRRTILCAVAFGLGSFVCEPRLRAQCEGGERSPSAEDHRTFLHQEIDLRASAAEIQETLLSAKRFSEFTRLSAHIDAKEGGAFSLFGGLIVGRNVEIVPATRIVQAWRPTHWEAGLYSMVRFALLPKGSLTTVVLDHTGFPEGNFDHLSDGWQAHYWEPLRGLFR
jgi:hypothetical protein